MVKALLLTGVLLAAPVAVLAQTAARPAPAEVAKGQRLYQARCAACHALDPARRTMGPSLAGIMGQPTAAQAGYAYSPALRALNQRWTPQLMSAFIERPQTAVRGTKMVSPPVANPADRAAIIAYLSTTRR